MQHLLEELDGGDAPTTTLDPCGHRFHVSCIISWFRSASNATSCPACRGQPDIHVTGWDLEDRCKVVMRRLRTKAFRDAYPELERMAENVRVTKKAAVDARKEFNDLHRANRELISTCRRLRTKQWTKKMANRRARRTLGLASLPMLLESPAQVTRIRRSPQAVPEVAEMVVTVGNDDGPFMASEDED